MSIVEKVCLALLGLFFLLAVSRLIKTPLKLAMRIIFNAALGFGAVWLLNRTTALTGLSLGLNIFNVATIGVLGVPGFFLLLLLKWVIV